jgi:ferredoxin-NADP reductase
MAGPVGAEQSIADRPALQADLVIAEIRPEAAQVVSLELRDPDGGELPAWRPGAHLDVRLSPEIERQYSLCGEPAELGSYRVAVLREPQSRGGSELVHGTLRVGDRVGVRGPRNNFELDPAPSYRFIAGGIGITPILPMVRAAAAAGSDWRLLYGGRRRDSMAFLEQLEPFAERVEVAPEEEHGLLDLDRELAEIGPGTLVYCCGPGPLLDAVEERCAGLPAGTLRVERFTPRDQVPAPTGDQPVVVECARSGLTVEVPAGTTILDALRAEGLELESSCEEGICGTCETRVLEGTPDHRDSLLSESEREEGRTMMICCSRAIGGRLVLDV